MRLRWRTQETPSQDESAADKQQAAEDSLRDAQHALEFVQEQKSRGNLIAETLARIRDENHFKDMWNEGLRGG